MRFEYDPRGRIVDCRIDEGGTPRFVLGRAHEGVVWRIGSKVTTNLVLVVTRLAGREKGIPIDGVGPPVPPDRLAPILRIFGEDAGRTLEASHEWVTRSGVTLGEIWTIA